MKKNKFLLLLLLLIATSPHVSICSQSGYLDYIKSFFTGAVNSATSGLKGMSTEGMKQWVSSLSDRGKVALFAVVASALGLAVYYTAQGKVAKVETKQPEIETKQPEIETTPIPTQIPQVIKQLPTTTTTTTALPNKPDIQSRIAELEKIGQNRSLTLSESNEHTALLK
ncbi:MAG TPA: hypothetical protein VGO09_08800, partial [Flavisolibacter sp.]|nr:hypothetical protein [Flavisolibacter sp.]